MRCGRLPQAAARVWLAVHQVKANQQLHYCCETHRRQTKHNLQRNAGERTLKLLQRKENNNDKAKVLHTPPIRPLTPVPPSVSSGSQLVTSPVSRRCLVYG